MAQGGARAGAGRKKGSTNTPELRAEQISRREMIKKTLDPLLVIYEHMAAAHKAGDADNAVKYAKEILPYVHGKQKDADESGNQQIIISVNTVDLDNAADALIAKL